MNGVFTQTQIELLKALVETVLREKGIDPNEEIWVDGRTAQSLLACKQTTLWKYRNDPSTGIEYSKTGKTILYRKSTLIAFIEKHKVQ